MGLVAPGEAIVAAVIDDVAGKLRREYEARGLIEAEMPDEPLIQFEEWFAGVVGAQLPEPNAFVLGTSTPDGRPSVRALLMKSIDEDGLTFYTNLASRKSREMRANPFAAATFVWRGLHRQVRFEGRIEGVAAEQADQYFASRPRGAQIAAHASNQSEVVTDRRVLGERFKNLEGEFEGEDVPRPDSWGGWCLVYETVEFWQGQPNRFHDRVRYRGVDGHWVKERLAP